MIVNVMHVSNLQGGTSVPLYFLILECLTLLSMSAAGMDTSASPG